MTSVRIVLAALAGLGIACHPGGDYAPSGRAGGGVDRGETNGRMFDFVSNRAEGDDWNIRIRGTSMNVSYGDGDKTKQLGTQNLDRKEADKVWELIDKLDIPSRGKGKKDEDSGYVQLRLREPGEDQHDIYSTFVSREEPPEDVVDLAEYLQKLVRKHFKTEPNF
jgi:hypothetical protein